jgi:hypothetical protein
MAPEDIQSQKDKCHMLPLRVAKFVERRGLNWWLMPFIPAEIGRIKVQGQPRQKVSETSISTSKLGVVVHICNPSYALGVGRRLAVRGQPGKKMGAPS